MSTTPDADELLEIVGKAESLQPRKWISLDGARTYVLALLAGQRRPSTREEWEDRARAINGDETTTKFGGLFAMADRQGRSLLLKALAVGDLNGRGMEQLPDQKQVMHDPLALKWWQRVVEAGKFTRMTPENPTPPRYTGSTSVGDEFPVHEVSWLDCAIRLRNPGSKFFDPPLAIVTGVEINHAQLLDLVKPLIDAHKEAASSAPAICWCHSSRRWSGSAAWMRLEAARKCGCGSTASSLTASSASELSKSFSSRCQSNS